LVAIVADRDRARNVFILSERFEFTCFGSVLPAANVFVMSLAPCGAIAGLLLAPHHNANLALSFTRFTLDGVLSWEVCGTRKASAVQSGVPLGG
jgi:hypothetical protein